MIIFRGRHYYWNTETDLVSWLPPGHPRCQVSRSAASLRKAMIADRTKRVQEERRDAGDSTNKDDEIGKRISDSQKRTDSSDDDDDDESDDSKGSDDSDSDSPSSRPPPPDLRDKRNEKSKLQKLKERERERERRAKRGKKDDLDPMDPASYGECPRYLFL